MRNGFLTPLLITLAGATATVAQAPLPVQYTPPSSCPTCTAPAPVAPEPEPAGFRLWGSADYLLWWTKDSPLSVPLATAGDIADTLPGALGQPGTVVVLGGSDIDSGTRSGGRFFVGAWLDQGQTFGVEGGYLFLGSKSVNQSVSTTGTPGSLDLFVPFVDANTGLQAAGPLLAVPTAGPNAFLPGPGVFSLNHATYLESWEANGLLGFGSFSSLRVQALVGFRYLNLHESLEFTTTSSRLAPALPPAFITTGDAFDARNFFYGGQLGLKTGLVLGKLELDLTTKVALGVMNQSLDVAGIEIESVPGTPFNFVNPSGSFTQPSNIGHYEDSRFAVLTDLNLNVGYRITRCIKVNVGYSFLYASSVTRPGTGIDPVINTTRTGFANSVGIVPVGPERPAPIFQDTDFWAHGVNFGLEFRW